MPSIRPRVILHVDMDAFFVSVELRRHPELVGKPVVVGGSGRRGVVAAASYEARRYGVFSAMPSSRARQRCPHAVFLPGDHDLYSSVSAQVHEIFGRYTPDIEPLSLDEAFLDVSGTARRMGGGVKIAQGIRRDVERELGLACSVGVAANKFVAKMASVSAKPVADDRGVRPGAGVVEVPPGSETEFLHPLGVRRLWGVGPKTQERLDRLGVRTIGQLAELDTALLVTALGKATGQHLHELAWGRDERPIESARTAKSVSHEETYVDNKYTRAELHVELVRLADAVAQRLRRSNTGARTLTIKVRFDDGFRTLSRSTTGACAVDTGPDIVAALEPLMAEIDPSPGVRLLGVGASRLGPVEQQLSMDQMFADQMFADRSSAGRSSADRMSAGLAPAGTADSEAAAAYRRARDWSGVTSALDEIRSRFGDASIGPASLVSERPGRGRAKPDGTDPGTRTPDRPSRGLRLVRRGQQQWGPNAEPSAEPTD